VVARVQGSVLQRALSCGRPEYSGGTAKGKPLTMASSMPLTYCRQFCCFSGTACHTGNQPKVKNHQVLSMTIMLPVPRSTGYQGRVQVCRTAETSQLWGGQRLRCPMSAANAVLREDSFAKGALMRGSAISPW